MKAWAAALLLATTIAGPAGAQAPATLVAAVGANLNHVPSFVGVEKGIFLKHGVDLKLKVLATGQEMTKALQAGEAQIVGAAFSNLPVALERGLAVKGVVGLMGDRSTRYSDEPVSIWTRRSTGIARIEDLAGRKVGTPVGGTGHEYLEVVLKKRGLSREKISIINVPPGNLVSALQGGSVDAVAVPTEPNGVLIAAKIPDALLLSRGGGHLGYYINMSMLVSVIDRSPDLVERYVTGMAEAAQYTRKNVDEAAEIATRWMQGLDVQVARQALRHMTFDPRITPQTALAWDDNVKILLEQKKLRSAVGWAQGNDPRFIDKVMKSHPQLFGDLKPVP